MAVLTLARTRFDELITLRLAKKQTGRIGCMGLALCAILLVAGSTVAEEAGGNAMEELKTQTTPSPVRMNPDKLAGVDLTPGEPFIAPEDILEGSHRPRGDSLYWGKELIVKIFEDDPAKLAIAKPFPVDEYVMVMSGKLILTDADGQVQEFVAGDSLMVPKGFTGTWQMLGNYRELIVVERESYENAFKAAEAGGSAMEEDKAQTTPSPVKMNPDKLAGVDLTPGEPFIAPEDILEGSHRPRGDSLYWGKELIVKIFEDDPAKLAIAKPFPVDEYVMVMSGKLILTDADGQVQEFVAGDSLMVPKGFTGTWQMLGNYRELIIVERESYENATKTEEK